MWAELRPALLITRREVRDQFRDWRIIFPIVGLTVFFPFLMNFTAKQALQFVTRYGATIVGERMVPFLLMIVGFFPISASLVIALDTFVGERERGSIEPLLNTPLKDWQLYLGKLLAAIVPTLAGSFLGMGVYLSGLVISRITLPDTGMILQIFALTIVQAVMMVSAAVVVSSQATSVRASNLLSSFIIIPAALLIQGESVVMFWGNTGTLWWVVAGVVVLTMLMVRVGLAHFRREELLGREIDVLNFRWGWGVFWHGFTGDARSIGDWLRRVAPEAVRSLRVPALLVAGIAVVAVWVGAEQIHHFQISLTDAGLESLSSQMGSTLGAWKPMGTAAVASIWWQNVRVLLLALVLGLFSFGVMGVMPIFASMGLVGYLMALLSTNGISPWIYAVGFILPHGILEIPAAVLAAAAVLQLGALIATPDQQRTVGEVVLDALGRWARIMGAWVIPLLLAGAMIEAWVTPQVAAALLR